MLEIVKGLTRFELLYKSINNLKITIENNFERTRSLEIGGTINGKIGRVDSAICKRPIFSMKQYLKRTSGREVICQFRGSCNVASSRVLHATYLLRCRY